MGKFSVSTPASSAGLMRFNDATGGGMKVEPQHVLAVAVIIIIAISVLRALIG
jgi:preprotein translocase subunit Sec61beta